MKEYQKKSNSGGITITFNHVQEISTLTEISIQNVQRGPPWNSYLNWYIQRLAVHYSTFTLDNIIVSVLMVSFCGHGAIAEWVNNCWVSTNFTYTLMDSNSLPTIYLHLTTGEYPPITGLTLMIARIEPLFAQSIAAEPFCMYVPVPLGIVISSRPIFIFPWRSSWSRCLSSI